MWLADARPWGRWYWIQDAGGTLTYAQTSNVLSALSYPVSGDFKASWKLLPASVASA